MDAWSYLYITNIGLIFIIFLVHLKFTRKYVAANRFFSLFLFTLAYTSFILLLYNSKLIFRFPHFARTGNFFLYLIYPSAYLFLRKMLMQEGWQKSDLLHLAPAFIYLVDFSPYFMKSAQEKRALLEQDFDSGNIFLIRQSALFLFNFHFIVRSLLSVLYCVLMARLWLKIFYGSQSLDVRTENRALMQWSFILISLLIAGIVPSVITFLFLQPVDLARLLNTSIYFATICLAVFVFFLPKVVSGVRGLLVHAQVTPNIIAGEYFTHESRPMPWAASAGKMYIREKKVQELGSKIEEAMAAGKPFLNFSYSIGDLSLSTGFSIHQISAFLKAYKGMNFEEYINSCRIRHLLNWIQEDSSWQQYTMEGLAQQLGFKNRYAFLNAFRRATGETPWVYLREKRNPRNQAP